MVKANVDRIIEYLAKKSPASINELSKSLNIKKDDVQRSAEYLEQDGVVKIEHKFPKTIVTLIKKPSYKEEEFPKEIAKTKDNSSVAINKAKINSSISSNNKIKSSPNKELSNIFSNNIDKNPLPLHNPAGSGFSNPVQSQVNANTANSGFFAQNSGQESPRNLGNSLDLNNSPVSENKETNALNQEDNIINNEINNNINNDVNNDVNNDLNLQFIQPVEPVKDSDPLNPEEPDFDMAPPLPESAKKPVFSYSKEFSAAKKISYPEYIKTDAEKIDYLIKEMSEKLKSRNYEDLNIIYRQAYELFENSSELSVNEKYILGEKLAEVFENIKDAYILNEAI